MFQEIGEAIRAQLATLEWVSRTGGATIPVEIRDGENYKTFPGCLAYEGAPCDAGDFVNLAPHEGETAIAFCEFTSDISTIRRTSRYSDISFQVRVVVWWDSRKVSATSDWALMDTVIQAVKAANIPDDYLKGAKIQFLSTQVTPSQIWDRYNMRSQGQGLFMYPYQTVGLNFNILGRHNQNCVTEEITADADAC